MTKKPTPNNSANTSKTASTVNLWKPCTKKPTMPSELTQATAKLPTQEPAKRNDGTKPNFLWPAERTKSDRRKPVSSMLWNRPNKFFVQKFCSKFLSVTRTFKIFV